MKLDTDAYLSDAIARNRERQAKRRAAAESARIAAIQDGRCQPWHARGLDPVQWARGLPTPCIATLAAIVTRAAPPDEAQ